MPTAPEMGKAKVRLDRRLSSFTSVKEVLPGTLVGSAPLAAYSDAVVSMRNVRGWASKVEQLRNAVSFRSSVGVEPLGAVVPAFTKLRRMK
jgi:hypothetical protein